MSEFYALPTTSPVLADSIRPELMVIGDSIYNGVRSATITGDLARWSPPAQIARDRKWKMKIPDYPYPILLDLEEEVRQGIDLSRIRNHAVQNAESWLKEPRRWSEHTFFDNIAIAGADYNDLHTATAGAAYFRIPHLYQKLKQTQSLDFETLALLWFNLNTAFLLNPSGHPDLMDLTPLEQVASRNPKRLLVNIGPNEGLFRIGTTANFSRENREHIKRIPKLARRLAKTLEKHCSGVDQIYFNLLIRPRTIANLSPRMDADIDQHPGKEYFEKYVGRLGTINGMSAEQMHLFDSEIAAVNTQTQQEMSKVLGSRIAFVDTFSMSTKFDGKHFGNKRSITVDAGKRKFRLSNRPFAANLLGFKHGGLFGLDNMHPTAVGYSLIANEVSNVVAKTEGSSPAKISSQAAFDADTLLQDPPRSWEALNFLFSLIADLGIVRLN